MNKLVDTFKQTADRIAFLDRGYGITSPDVQSAIEEVHAKVTRENPQLDIISVADHGVIGDGIADDTQALNDVATLARNEGKMLYMPSNMICRITDTVNLRNIVQIEFHGSIIVDMEEGVGVVFGYNTDSRTPTKYYFRRVSKSNSESKVIPLRLAGLQNGLVTVHYCDHFQLYANHAVSDQRGIAYSTFFMGNINHLELFGEPGGTSWINENLFVGGRYRTFTLRGEYHHNHNVWLRPGGDSMTWNIEVGHSNHWYNVRGEGSHEITFAAGTRHNYIQYSRNANDISVIPSFELTDEGNENLVSSRYLETFRRTNLLRIDHHLRVYDSTAEIKGLERLEPTFDGLWVHSHNGEIVRVRIPLTDDTPRLYEWRSDSDTPRLRPVVYGYDKNGNLVNANTTPFMSTLAGWAVTEEGYYSMTTNRMGDRILITNDTDVAYIEIALICGSGSGVIRGFQIDAYTDPTKHEGLVTHLKRQIQRTPYQDSAPTQGFAYPGDRVEHPNGYSVCVAQGETTLEATYEGGNVSTIEVGDASDMQPGDVIAIQRDDLRTTWRIIDSIDGNQVTLNERLSATNYTKGNKVAYIRWKTHTFDS